MGDDEVRKQKRRRDQEGGGWKTEVGSDQLSNRHGLFYCRCCNRWLQVCVEEGGEIMRNNEPAAIYSINPPIHQPKCLSTSLPLAGMSRRDVLSALADGWLVFPTHPHENTPAPKSRTYMRTRAGQGNSCSDGTHLGTGLHGPGWLG